MYSVHAGFMDFHTDYKFREYRKSTQMCIYNMCIFLQTAKNQFLYVDNMYHSIDDFVLVLPVGIYT